MPVIRGKGMVVDGEATTREWKIRYKSVLADYRASDTQGATNRCPGNILWEGLYLGYGAESAAFPGQEFDFKAHVGNGQGYSGRAICRRLQIDCPVERAGPMEYAVWFASAGTLIPGAVEAVGGSGPNPACSKGRKVYYGATKVGDVRFWRLIFEDPLVPYVSDETDGWVFHNSDHLDVTAQVLVYEDTPAAIPAPNSEDVWKFYTADAVYWLIDKLIVEGPEDYGPSLEQKTNVGGLVVAKLKSFTDGVTGQIVGPSNHVWWPESVA